MGEREDREERMQALRRSMIAIGSLLAIVVAVFLWSNYRDKSVKSCAAEKPDPVCGVDGATYDNACKAAKAAARIVHRGACVADAYPIEVYP